ncbi:MAG: hypothetical protein K8F24_02020, partial [Bacteroidales bacterium]|nr:hypothetical protein [Bacteroidales bacterium]
MELPHVLVIAMPLMKKIIVSVSLFDVLKSFGRSKVNIHVNLKTLPSKAFLNSKELPYELVIAMPRALVVSAPNHAEGSLPIEMPYV